MDLIDFSKYNYDKRYKCSKSTECGQFSKLMYLITNHLNDNIKCSIDSLLDYIVNHPEEINSRNEYGWSPLMLASLNSNTNSNLETVKLLLENGADVNIEVDGCTALMIASRYSNTDSNLQTVKLLLENGADVNMLDTDGWTALMMVSLYSNTDSNLETAKLLIENGADVNMLGTEGWTALMIASRFSNTSSNLETVKLLLENRADINIKKQNNGWTALMFASYFSNTDSNLQTVEILLKYGASTNAKNNKEQTALILAAQNINKTSNIETVKLILLHNASPNIIDNQNKSFFEYLSGENLLACHNILVDVQHRKQNMKFIFSQIHLQCAKIVHRPDSIRSKILEVKWDFNNKKLTNDEIFTKQSDLVNYLNAMDSDTLDWKLKYIIKYMD